MKKIMIIGAGELQIPLIKICIKNGYKVIATDMNEDAVGLKYADESIVVDGTDKEKILNYAQKFNIDGIVTTGEAPLFTVAYVCSKLGLKGPSMKAAQVSNDKYLMRKCMSENDIESPKYWLIHNIDELDNIRNKISFPLVIKPVDVSGSLGVIKINNEDEMELKLDEVLSCSKNGSAIIEEFLDGPEFSVETLSQNGIHNIIAITEKKVSGYPYFVEERHIVPANITDEQKMEISKMVVRLLDACNFDNCAGHTEVKLTKNGSRIIETGARIGGDYITADLVPLATGISMHENIARIALGEEALIEKNISKFSGIQYITSENYDLVLSSKNKINLKNFIRFSQENLDKEHKLKCSNDRLGYYICVGQTRKELIEKLDFYKN